MTSSTFLSLENTYGDWQTATNHVAATDLPAANHGEQESELHSGDSLSIVLMSPDDSRREAVAASLRASAADVREVSAYPSSLDQLPQLLDQRDAVILDLDSDPERALGLVERISATWAGTVMVFSAEAGSDKLMRSMRAGAREFFTVPVERNAMEEALVRAMTRRPTKQTAGRTEGKLLTFMGAKGGLGVTTAACNFALALADQRDRSTVLIDLALPMGDAALSLGLQSEYSVINALQAADRLDSSFLSNLLVKHASGLAVLAGPDRFVPYEFTSETVGKLFTVARQSFDYVVVDAGSRLDLREISLFKDASTIYLIAQVGVAEMRNSNRLISQFFSGANAKVEIVLNRYDPRSTALSEEYIAKVLTKSPQWKIPNDYASVRRMQTDATPLVPGDSATSKVIQEMARAVTGQPAPKKKKKAFVFFG